MQISFRWSTNASKIDGATILPLNTQAICNSMPEYAVLRTAIEQGMQIARFAINAEDSDRRMREASQSRDKPTISRLVRVLNFDQTVSAPYESLTFGTSNRSG